MAETWSPEGSRSGKEYFRRHWKMFTLFVAAAILLGVGAVLVFLWFVGQAQITGLVPSLLGQWTLGNVLAFLLNLLFWELLLIGIPAAVAAIAVWLWWRRLPPERRWEWSWFGGRSRGSRGGNAASLLIFIAFLIKVYLDGNWNIPIATWTFDYLVYSWITALVWVLIIFAIPAVIGITWWLTRGRKEGL